MTFGTKLKSLRVEYELTQSQLAKKLDTSKSNISKYESDSIEPNMKTLVLISEYFNVSIDYLLGTSNIRNITHPSLSKEETELIEYYNYIHNSTSLSFKEKKKLTLFFPFATFLQSEEKELIGYYNKLSLMNRRWIMGQMIDLIKKADEKDMEIPKAQ